MANRLPNIQAFATRHDVVLFVSGLKSSNGRVLYEACRRVNPRSYLVDTPAALQREWFDGAESVGVCGVDLKIVREDLKLAFRIEHIHVRFPKGLDSSDIFPIAFERIGEQSLAGV